MHQGATSWRTCNYGALIGLTPALTGTAPAARRGEDGGRNNDGGSEDRLRGCVRGRMQG
jgi:hypothetical protein